MTQQLKRIILPLGIAAIVIGGGAAYWKRHSIDRALERASLPRAMDYDRAKPSSIPAATPLPAEVNLKVPFTPQAPHLNWDLPYNEFCEEASVYMAISYVRGQPIPNRDAADRALLEIRAFEEKTFGSYKDTNIAKTAQILTDYYGYHDVRLLENPTVFDMKQAVAGGKLVLIPAAGRRLGNPYFRDPGPLYHMLVLKGYTADGKFIVNDPGTWRGADFLYAEDVIMDAMHDWRDDRKIDLGLKIVLIVG
jgi:hypothetical protein